MTKAGILMKKYLTYIIAVFIMTSLLIFAVPMKVLADNGNEYTITELSAEGEIISDVNVRKGPSTDYEKIGTVRQGDNVTVTGESHDGWYRIVFQDTEGFIYGQYMTIVQTTSPEMESEDHENGQPEQTKEPSEPEEKTSFNFSAFKAIAIVVIIAVIIVMIFLTIKSMRQTEEERDDDDDEDEEEDDDDDDEEYDDDDDDDEEYEDDDDEEYEDDEENDDEDGEDEEEPVRRSSSESKSIRVETAKIDPRTIVIREEDYQLHIDPKYFEDDPIAQPDCVTGYLQKKEQEEKEKAAGENAGDLQKAMDKLQELQEEIEKLKNKQ